MATLNPYLNFMGNTEEAFNFYKSVFGGDFTVIQRMNATPQADQLSEADKNKIMHVALPIGSNTLMGTDMIESMGHKMNRGNNISLSLSTESEAETEKLFKALSAGGKVDVPLEKASWGAYFGMCTDKFGIQWMVNFDMKNK
jgi:PhnB protein